jgi:heme oxygenase
MPTPPSTQAADPVAARAALRTATAEIHERLHRLPDFAALLAGRLDRAGYRTLLTRLYGFHAPLEAALIAGAERLASVGIAMEDRRRVPALASDLAALGVAPAEMAALPRCRDLPSPVSLGELLGCLYVREGSTLGGAVIAERLAPLLPGGAGRRFFVADAAARGRLWRECCAALDAAAAAPGALATMTAAARATFAAFETWLTRSPAWTM